MGKRCEMEMALHGYNHSYHEFESLSYNESYDKIMQGLNVIHEIHPKIITFIPPYNLYSNGTKKALEDLEFKIISTENQHEDYNYSNDYGYTQTTYDWNTKKLVDYKEILRSCNQTLNHNQTCIITIHPQDFVTKGKLDLIKYINYLDLLDNLDSLNATIINFRDLEKD